MSAVTTTTERMAAFDAEEAARLRLPIFLGAFDEETSAMKIIAAAEAAGEVWVANKNAGHDRYPVICGYLQAELQRVCTQLHELQHRPGETKARTNRKRLLREAMSRRAA